MKLRLSEFGEGESVLNAVVHRLAATQWLARYVDIETAVVEWGVCSWCIECDTYRWRWQRRCPGCGYPDPVVNPDERT